VFDKTGNATAPSRVSIACLSTTTQRIETDPQIGCKVCAAWGVKCPGFEVRLAWPSDVAGSKRRGKRPARSNTGSVPVDHVQQKPNDSMVRTLSPLGLPEEESFFMQHFLRECDTCLKSRRMLTSDCRERLQDLTRRR
jgi:hypothetical protein